MFYKSELDFLIMTAKKLRVRVALVPEEIADLSNLSEDLRFLLKANGRFSPTLFKQFKKAKENTVYKITDPFGACIIFLALPNLTPKKLVSIGPFLSTVYTSERFLELAEKFSISHSDMGEIEKFYMGLPVISDDSHFYAMLDCFCEFIWGGDNYSIVNGVSDSLDTPFKNQKNDSETSVEENTRSMEERYSFEDELMSAISKGLTHKADRFLGSFSPAVFERRLSDPLRNAKNYAIIMNTLCRKAAQQGSVHPVYLDSLSSDFARKIETMQKTSDIEALMGEMFRSYCRLVRKHSMKNYSPPVQKAIIYIDSDLSGDLSLKRLSAAQNLSEGYLSALFSKEVGVTLTEFVNEKRIKYARHLLSTTSLQIQTIALHCGFPDVHYFSKVFKKHTGVSPITFRKNST